MSGAVRAGGVQAVRFDISAKYGGCGRLVYLLSFVNLAIFWVSHSIQFRYVRRANRNLFWINILVLMLVACIPFSIHLLSEHIEQQFAVAFYGTHLMLIWLCLFLAICVS